MSLQVKTIFITGLLQIILFSQASLSVSQALEPPKGDNGYNRILNQTNLSPAKKFEYLKNYHLLSQNCYMDASVLAVQYYFDKKMSKVLTPEEYDPKPFGLSPGCLDLSLTMKADIYFVQYQICSALAKKDGSDASFGVCEELGKEQTSTGLPVYSFEYTDDERAAIKKNISTFRTQQEEELKKATKSAAPEITVPDYENPLSILRFRLFYESIAYKNAMTELVERTPKSEGARQNFTDMLVQGISLSAAAVKEAKFTDMTNDNAIEWFQEFFLSYPQHLHYLYLQKQLKETTQQFDRIARVLIQLKYKLPNSSVDGDKNKGK